MKGIILGVIYGGVLWALIAWALWLTFPFLQH
jgi:hypothetical protein